MEEGAYECFFVGLEGDKHHFCLFCFFLENNLTITSSKKKMVLYFEALLLLFQVKYDLSHQYPPTLAIKQEEDVCGLWS